MKKQKPKNRKRARVVIGRPGREDEDCSSNSTFMQGGFTRRIADAMGAKVKTATGRRL
jgi:hypothetical protein